LRCGLVGAGAWLALAALRPEEGGDLAAIEALLALHLLCLTPLLLALWPPRGGVWTRALWLAAAALATGSALLGPAHSAAASALALPWVGLAAWLLGEALGEWGFTYRRWGLLESDSAGLRAVSRLFLLVGAGWLVFSRSGLPLPGLDAEKILLAAVHAHYTGFGALSLMALAAWRAGPGERRGLLAAGIGLGVGFGLTGAGIAFSPLLEPLGATVLAFALATYAALRLPQALSLEGAARALSVLSLVGLALGLCLGLAYAARVLGPTPLTRAHMIHLHGVAIGLGFLLCGATGALLGEARERPGPLLLYDGVCGLCDKSVQWILNHDQRAQLRFTPLQGETARPLLERYELAPAGEVDFDTVVLVGPGDRARVRSQAAFGVLLHMGGVWRLLGHLGGLVPRPLADVGYRLVASNRLRFFGSLDACRIPRPEERVRFLP